MQRSEDLDRLARVEAEGHQTRQDVAGLKAQVGALGASMSEVSAGQDRLEQLFLNKQPTWTPPIILGLIAGVLGFLVGIQEYVALTQEPIKGAIVRIIDRMEDDDSNEKHIAAFISKQEAINEYITEDVDTLSDSVDVLEQGLKKKAYK